MLQPVYPQLRKYPCATAVTLGAKSCHYGVAGKQLNLTQNCRLAGWPSGRCLPKNEHSLPKGMQPMDERLLVSGCVFDNLAQPQMSGLIIEPAMPKHRGADNRRCKGKPADRKAVGPHPMLGEAAAEHRHHIGAGEDGRGRETGGAVRDVPGLTSRAEPPIDKARIFAARRDFEI